MADQRRVAFRIEGQTDPRPSRQTEGGSRSRYARSDSHDTVPDAWLNLDEVAATCPVEDPIEPPNSYPRSLEQTRFQDHERRASLPTSSQATAGGVSEAQGQPPPIPSPLLTQLYTLSYLILFAILGTLARIGLSALTEYPGAPVVFGSIWPNFAGSLVMGFLLEDTMLFRSDATTTRDIEQGRRSVKSGIDNEASQKSSHLAAKKKMPLYIGASTGFCGSLTSFSAFIRDAFLALSNEIPTPGAAVATPVSRNGGESFMAVLAVLILTIALSLSALVVGAHIAVAMRPFIPSTRYAASSRFIDPLAAVLGWGSWLGAILLAIFPPHDAWRGRAVFAIVFAPLGCLVRFYASLHLNGMVPSFPLGTFVVNVFGTGVLGMAWDIAHVPMGGVIGCQVLQGVEDGFCGALTTVSTWVAELSSLRRRHAYIYGTGSVAAALALLILIMGGLRWSDGFSPLLCST